MSKQPQPAKPSPEPSAAPKGPSALEVAQQLFQAYIYELEARSASPDFIQRQTHLANSALANLQKALSPKG